MRVNKTWVPITQCRNIPLREGRAVEVDGRVIAIFNLGDRFLAANNQCPHRKGPLADGIVFGHTVVCPLHAWKFSLETGEGSNTASALSCIETFRTRVEAEVIWLEMPTEPAGKETTACIGHDESVIGSGSSPAPNQ